MDEGRFQQARGVKHSAYWPTMHGNYHTQRWFYIQVYCAFNDQRSHTQNSTYPCINRRLLASHISFVFGTAMHC